MASAVNQKSVLVVEDDRALSSLLADLFALKGYRVIQSYDGGEAYDIIRKEHPDVVTLDLMLPGMLGQDLLRHAKGDPATGDIRFVVVSAWSQALGEDERQLADAVFSKPFEVDKLLGTVYQLVRAPSSPPEGPDRR